MIAPKRDGRPPRDTGDGLRIARAGGGLSNQVLLQKSSALTILPAAATPRRRPAIARLQFVGAATPSESREKPSSRALAARARPEGAPVDRDAVAGRWRSMTAKRVAAESTTPKFDPIMKPFEELAR